MFCSSLLLGCPQPLDNGNGENGEEETEELTLSSDYDGDGYSNDDELVHVRLRCGK